MSAIAVVGNSGTGKTTSIGNFPDLGIEGMDPKTTAIINVAGKDLPFKGWRKNYVAKKFSEGGNYLTSHDHATIAETIRRVNQGKKDGTLPFEDIILDDAQYLMAFDFMNRVDERGFDKFTEIGAAIYEVLSAARQATHINVYFMWHPEQSEMFGAKMKTVGALVDKYLTLEGLFTVILYTKVSSNSEGMPQYQFVTNHLGTNHPAKSPIGMFKDITIPNDLGYVKKAIHEYNYGE